MSLSTQDFYRFDEFELQPSRRALVRAGERVAVAPKSFEVLLYLVQHAGRVVLKEELLKAVWPDSFVEESNLTQHIFWLRKALAEKAGYIVTVPGRGYEFTGQVQEVSGGAAAGVAAVEAEFQLHHSTEVTRVVVEETTVTRTAAVGAPLWRVWAGVAAVAAVALAAWGTWAWRHQVVPGDHHEIVLADFENSTGDPDFDRALKTLLVFDLNRSPFLVVASESDTRKTMKLMKRPADGDLTAPVAREVCERLNDQAVLAGLIARLGQKYLVTLTASDCSTGKDLVQTRAEAANRDGVVGAVDEVAAEMRKKLGEPLRKLSGNGEALHNSAGYLPPVHTYSLEALKLYSQARAFHYKAQFKEAAALYQQAIELDPNFASAYSQLANCYNNLGEQSLGEKAMEKAYNLRDQTDGPDRLRITTMYEYWKTGNRHVAVENYRNWTQMYPRNAYPWIMLGEFEDAVGDRADAIEAEKTAIALDPLQLSAYISLATFELSEGRFDDLKATNRKATEHGYESPDMHRLLALAAWCQHDEAGIAAEMAWLKDKGEPGDRESVEAELDMAEGKVGAGLALMLHQVDDLKKQERAQASAEKLAEVAQTEADLELLAPARQHLKQLVPPPEVNGEAMANIIMTAAQTGDFATAERELHKLLEKNKQDSDVQEFFAPEAAAMIDLARGKPGEAISALGPALPYAHVYPSVSDFRGRAFLATKQPQLAAEEFRLITEHPSGYMGTGLATAHLGLARALQMEGDKAGARQEYANFLAMWKDADAGLPMMVEAKREMAALGAKGQ